MKITLTIPGKPMPQKRHRSARGGWMYDPSKKDKESFLLKCGAQWNLVDLFFMTGKEPIKIKLKFYCPYMVKHHLSNSRHKPLKKTLPDRQIDKPDLDNLIKFVLDALNGYYYNDDKQVYKIEAEKRYSEKPRTEIIIEI